MSGFQFNRRWNRWDGGEYGWETCPAELGVRSIDRKMCLRHKGRSAWQVCAVDFNVTMSLRSSSITCSMISNGRCIGNVGRRGILIVVTWLDALKWLRPKKVKYNVIFGVRKLPLLTRSRPLFIYVFFCLNLNNFHFKLFLIPSCDRYWLRFSSIAWYMGTVKVELESVWRTEICSRGRY